MIVTKNVTKMEITGFFMHCHALPVTEGEYCPASLESPPHTCCSSDLSSFESRGSFKLCVSGPECTSIIEFSSRLLIGDVSSVDNISLVGSTFKFLKNSVAGC